MQRRELLSKIALMTVGLLLIAAAAGQQTAPANRLSIEQLIEIKHPSNPVSSPDGKQVAFIWDRANIGNLYLANSDGRDNPAALTSYTERGVTDPFWSLDGRSIYYSRDGHLCQVMPGGRPQLA